MGKTELDHTGGHFSVLDVIAFAVLWAFGKGLMNQNAFDYPQGQEGASPTFVLYLLVAVITAIVIAKSGLVSNRRQPTLILLAALGASAGAMLLLVFQQSFGAFIGAAVCAIGMALLQTLCLARFMILPLALSAFEIGAAFFLGNALGWAFSVPHMEMRSYLFYVIPCVSALLVLRDKVSPAFPVIESKENQACSDLEGLRIVSTPFLGYFAFATISISISYLFMAQGPISQDMQTFFHLLAPTVGAGCIFFLVCSGRWRVPLIPLVYLVMACALLLVPFLGMGYLEFMKVFSMAASEALCVYAMCVAAEVTSEYRMDGAFLPSVMLALLSASTLVGVGVGSLSVFLTSLEVTPYVFIGVFSFFFLLVTVLLLLGMQRDKRLVASYPVMHAKIDSVIAVSRKFGMTRREEEILRLLMEEKNIARDCRLSLLVEGYGQRAYQEHL